jgi:heterotetrameric sarcosine oxidase gamma subunit
MRTSILQGNDCVAERPLARGPIAPAMPLVQVAGWEVSGRQTDAPLRLADHTPLAKIAVRADPAGAFAQSLRVPFGRAARNPYGTLVIGASPGEWLLLAPPGDAAVTAERARGSAADEPVSVLDLSHGRALVRLTGAASPEVLAKLCAIDLADRATPDGAAFRSHVAHVVTDVIRDDLWMVPPGSAGMANGAVPQDARALRSYLLHCERSVGQYLYDCLLDAGAEFGIEIDGFRTPGI